MFEDGKIVNRFIEGWRVSGQQRVGYLYGRYIPLESDIPLGIRAEVAAIYEPPQVGVGGYMDGSGGVGVCAQVATGYSTPPLPTHRCPRS